MNLNDPASPRDVVNGDDLVPPHVAELILSFPEVQKILENDQEQFDKWIEQIAFPSWFLNALKTLSYGEARFFLEGEGWLLAMVDQSLSCCNAEINLWVCW